MQPYSCWKKQWTMAIWSKSVNCWFYYRVYERTHKIIAEIFATDKDKPAIPAKLNDQSKSQN